MQNYEIRTTEQWRQLMNQMQKQFDKDQSIHVVVEPGDCTRYELQLKRHHQPVNQICVQSNFLDASGNNIKFVWNDTGRQISPFEIEQFFNSSCSASCTSSIVADILNAICFKKPSQFHHNLRKGDSKILAYGVEV